ncbi:HAD family hydrolase [Arthrobacter rhombi]|uniref:HAD family hydrolase n=1 Tax=Arthrobacter rhombi TaxID=71253 RepID=UPI003FD5A084
MGAPRHAVLFDVDGTLVDSTYWHTVSWWQALRQHGHTVQMSRIHRAIGMGGDKLVSHVVGENVDADQEQALKDAHAAIFSTHWPQLTRFEGVKELLRACHGAGAAVVFASSAQGPQLEVLRRTIDADDFLTAATSSSDASASKPEPDIVEAALESAGVAAEQAIFIGDAVWDVHACAKLGLPVIGLACGGTSAAELREAGALEVHEQAADLLAHLQVSALGRLLDAARDGS